MNDRALSLRQELAGFLRWERLKRRERLLLSAACTSLLVALIALPTKELWRSWANPLVIPVAIFLILSPVLFLLGRWRRSDSLRAVWLLDKKLGMEERAVTAWEILSQGETGAAELLVVEQAEERLRGIDPRTLFKRRLTWREIAAPALFVLWLFLAWFDGGLYWQRGLRGSQSDEIARKLKEYSRSLQERANAQGLGESLEAARSLEKVAEERLRDESNENRLRQSLAGMVERLRARDKARATETETDLPLGMASQEALSDLKTELEALKETLYPNPANLQDRPAGSALEQLGNLPHLREWLEKGLPSAEKLETKDLERLLQRLEKGVVAELDQRMLLEIEEFLDHLLEGSEGQGRETLGQQAGRAEEGLLSRGARTRTKGSLPGDQPGSKEQSGEPLPAFGAAAATHLKGLWGEGKDVSLSFRGVSRGGKSQMSQEEVLAAYRRQAEEEIASEHIPEGLRETVKKYFLSLGMGKK